MFIHSTIFQNENILCLSIVLNAMYVEENRKIYILEVALYSESIPGDQLSESTMLSFLCFFKNVVALVKLKLSIIF